MTRIRVLVVDDHPVVRQGLAAMVDDEPDMQVVAQAASVAEAAARFREAAPDVTLVDLKLPDGTGIELITRLRGESPEARFVVLTTLDSEEHIFRAVEAGAQAYVLKDMAAALITEAVRLVHRGERMLPPAIAEKLEARGLSLSRREVQILELVAAGESNKTIAARLGVEETTVKMHLLSVFRKLGVHDRAGAVIAALRRGMISL